MNKKNYYIPTLDGWRAISILMVIMCHGLGHYVPSFEGGTKQFLYQLTDAGGHGVSIFFVISGYLITSRILVEKKTFGYFNIKDFYLKRFWRIFPPFLLYFLTLIFFNYFSSFSLSTKEIIYSIFFIQIFLRENTVYIGHFWSLNVEEHFYFILSAIFGWFKKIPTEYILFFLLTTLFITRYSLHHFVDASFRKEYSIFFESFLSMDFMFWGTIFALIENRLKVQNIFHFFTKFSPIVFFLLFLLIFHQYKFKIYILPLYTAFTVVLLTKDYKSIIGTFLETKLIAYIGKISYSLYLWQQFFLTSSKGEIAEISFIQNNIFSYILLFLIASFSHYYVEKPFIKFGRKFIKHKI